MKNRKNYFMERSPTLTQSGLLAVLLQRQRYKTTHLAQRRAHRKQLRAAFWSALARPSRPLTARTRVDSSAKPLVGTAPHHTWISHQS